MFALELRFIFAAAESERWRENATSGTAATKRGLSGAAVLHITRPFPPQASFVPTCTMFDQGGVCVCDYSRCVSGSGGKERTS